MPTIINNTLALFFLKFCTMFIWLIIFGYIIGYFNGDQLSTYYLWLILIGQLVISAIWSVMAYFLCVLIVWCIPGRRWVALTLSYFILYFLELFINHRVASDFDQNALYLAIFGVIFSYFIFVQLYKGIGYEIMKYPTVLP